MTDPLIHSSTGSPPVIQSEILQDSDRVVHAFGTRQGGVSRAPYATLNLGMSVGDDPHAVEENRRRFFGTFNLQLSQVVRVRQVHGDGVLRVDESLVSRAGFPRLLLDEAYEYDGLVTNLPDLALVVTTADCLPLLIHDPVRGAVAAVHAGWRSTAKGIAARAIETMAAAYGTDPGDCRVAIGPGIRRCCYEVDATVTDAMRAALPTWAEHTVATRPDHFQLDLAGVNRAILMRAGVRPDRIADVGLCTACRTDLFFSHRAEKSQTGRMMNLILIKRAESREPRTESRETRTERRETRTERREA
jgi:YfiH family protein